MRNTCGGRDNSPWRILQLLIVSSEPEYFERIQRMASKVQKLRELTTKPATAEHQEEYDKQTSANADDRSFCLLLTAMLENELDRAIDNWIGEQPTDLRKNLYDHDGPLGNFSRKITIAAALEIIGPISHENFRLIRHVRNAFAHAKVPITFKTPEVSAVCADLVRVNIFDPPEEVDQSPQMPPRDRFETVCHETMVRMMSYTGQDPHFKDDTGKERAILREPMP
jgi:hypothetical protein